MALTPTPKLKLKRFDLDTTFLYTDTNTNLDKIDSQTSNSGNMAKGNSGVTFNSVGVGTLTHNLGWVPNTFVVGAFLSPSLTIVDVNLDVDPTATTISLRAWKSDGSVYDNRVLSKVNWIAFK